MSTGRIGIVGAGSWGTTLAIIYARQGFDVVLWDHDVARAASMQRERLNATYLPSVAFPDLLTATSVPQLVSKACDCLIIALPTQALTSALKPFHGHTQDDTPVLIVSKGIESVTNRLVSDIVTHAALTKGPPRLAVMSGPNLAGEILREAPAASVVASTDTAVSSWLCHTLSTPRFRLYASDDVRGVELGGALKNVMAIAAGLVDGLGYGDNSKASLLTRGLAEISRLGVAFGAHAATFYGLSGIGDLIATSSSGLSRNHHVGYELGRGQELHAVLAGMTSVAEGVETTKAARQLALDKHIDMPIVEQIYGVLFDGKSAGDAVDDLLSRAVRDERTGDRI